MLLQGLTPKKSIPNCRVRTLLSELDADDAAILKDAVDNAIDWSVNGLETALSERGVKLSGKSITLHRTGRCSCSQI